MYNLVPKKKAKVLKQQEKAGPTNGLFLSIRHPNCSLTETQKGLSMTRTLCLLLYNSGFIS